MYICKAKFSWPSGLWLTCSQIIIVAQIMGALGMYPKKVMEVEFYV